MGNIAGAKRYSRPRCFNIAGASAPAVAPAVPTPLRHAPPLFLLGPIGKLSIDWMSADPRLWTKTQVLQWLNWAIHEFSLENVVRSQFCLSGARLLQLSRDEFLRRAPPFVGDILHEHLDVLQKGRFCRRAVAR